MSTYRPVGSTVVLHDEERATCSDPATAAKACDMLNRARVLNDVKRRYTAAARLIAAVETLPGFMWTSAP